MRSTRQVENHPHRAAGDSPQILWTGMTAAYGFSPASEEKGIAMWVDRADWHSVKLTVLSKWPSMLLSGQWAQRHLQGMACTLGGNGSLSINYGDQITFLKTYLRTCKLNFWDLGFFPLCLTLHTLCGATPKVWHEAASLDWCGSRQSTQTAQDKGKETKHLSSL